MDAKRHADQAQVCFSSTRKEKHMQTLVPEKQHCLYCKKKSIEGLTARF